MQINLTLPLEHFPPGWSSTEINSHWNKCREGWLTGIRDKENFSGSNAQKIVVGLIN